MISHHIAFKLPCQSFQDAKPLRTARQCTAIAFSGEKIQNREGRDREIDKNHWRQEKKVQEREKGKKRRTYPSHSITSYHKI